MQKTYSAKKADIKRTWYLIDAEGLVLGRVASSAARILRGKHKVEFTRNLDMGDFVVIINVEKIKYTGKKMEQKQYIRHSGYPGGLKIESLKEVIAKNPTLPLRKAITGMIPANRLKKSVMRRLKLYAHGKHQHSQKLIPLSKNL
jgi:large subunit ribosomal protein L13